MTNQPTWRATFAAGGAKALAACQATAGAASASTPKYARFSFTLPEPRPSTKRTIRILRADIDNADILATQIRVSTGATYVQYRKPKQICDEWWGNLKWGDSTENVQNGENLGHSKAVALT